MVACLAMLSVSGCESVGPATEPGCEWAQPIYVSRDDVLTEGTARQILRHNETWAANCPQ